MNQPFLRQVSSRGGDRSINLSAVFNALDIPILVINDLGIVVRANAASEPFIGESAYNFLGKRLSEILHAGSRLESLVQRAINQKTEITENGFTLCNPNYKASSVFEISAAPIPDIRDHVVLYVHEKTLSKSAPDTLKGYFWPENVRELENLMKRLTVLANKNIISTELIKSELSKTGNETTKQTPTSIGNTSPIEHHLKEYFQAHRDKLPATGLYERFLREIEKPLISLTLDATGGNQIKAAEILGLNRNTLRKKIKGLSIEVARGRR